MYQRKKIEEQLQSTGVRLGDSCSIMPIYGRRKAFTLNRKKIDLVSSLYRPKDLSMSYIELPISHREHFHYRLEIEHANSKEGRFILRTLAGNAFWLNGLAAKEAYIERLDKLYLDDNKINFSPFNLKELTALHFEHPILLEQNLLESNLNILICGETGTGKTHLAKKIHERSKRPGPFVSINLSSFNTQLIESELFGHKKGSFTGAYADKKGAFAQAEHGTLFLDEIDSLSLEMQTKLLTFIDNKRFRRVGDLTETLINARLIFASGKPMDQLVEQGLFRKDFYFRLKSGHTLELTSLRNDVTRIKDACQFFSLENNVSLSERLIEFYQTLAWPGNLRQLLGHLEKKKVLSRTTKLDFDPMDEELMLKSSDLLTFETLSEIDSMERMKINYLRKVLGFYEGNVQLTAKKLKLSPKTIRTLMQKI